MQTDNNTLIDELLVVAQACTSAARKLKTLPEDQLNNKSDAKSWSALECIEHLNRYGDYYLPAIERTMLSGPRTSHLARFSSGWLGDYFANLMKVTDGKIVKMRTPADKNPSGSVLTATTIDRFLKQQALLESLLERGREADLTGTRVPTSLTRLIRLRLGDTFRFFVYHIERHILQARRAAEEGAKVAIH